MITSASLLVSIAGTLCSEGSAIVLSVTMLTFSSIDQNTNSPNCDTFVRCSLGEIGWYSMSSFSIY